MIIQRGWGPRGHGTALPDGGRGWKPEDGRGQLRPSPGAPPQDSSLECSRESRNVSRALGHREAISKTDASKSQRLAN